MKYIVILRWKKDTLPFQTFLESKNLDVARKYLIKHQFEDDGRFKSVTVCTDKGRFLGTLSKRKDTYEWMYDAPNRKGLYTKSINPKTGRLI